MPARLSPARAALFFALATVVLTWPMALRPGELYGSRQDLYLGLWNLWWVGGWVSHPSSELFHTDLLLFPFGAGLEVQPLSLFQSVLAAPLTLSLGPVVAFNLLALASFWFAGWMTYTWVRELSGDAPGALVAGVVFSFSPYHFTYLPELNLLPVGTIPLYLWCALRLERVPSVRRAALAGAALAVVGLCDWYYGLATGLVALGLSARRGLARALPPSQRAGIEALHWGTCALVLFPVVLRMAPGFLGEEFGAGAEREGMALVMPGFKGTGYTVWLHSYAGVAACLLAALGCLSFRRALPALVLGALAFLLSLGPSLSVGGSEVPLPFALLERLPLLGNARYPDRFFVLTQLALALLASEGAARVARWMEARGRSGAAAHAGCALLVLLEVAPGGLSSATMPESIVPPRDEGDAGAVFHVPTRIRSRDGEQMWLQLDHRRPIAGGYLTRRAEESVRRVSEDPALGALVGSKAGAQPATLREDLIARGFAYVSVLKSPLHPGNSMVAGTLAGSFRTGGSGYLRQRLFPGYQDPREIAAETGAWIRELTLVLGPPVRETEREALFRLAVR
jgi:hypothetical protein